MKKLIIIWLAVIVILIVGGIVWSKIDEKIQAQNAPEEDLLKVTYTDDDGKEQGLEIPNKPIEITIDGEVFEYNPYIWWGQPFTIGKDEFAPDHYLANFAGKGYNEISTGCFQKQTKDKTYNIYIEYNPFYDFVTRVRMYSPIYEALAGRAIMTCEDVVLPCNIKLGITKKEEVEKYFGECYEMEVSDKFINVQYYAQPDGVTSKSADDNIRLIYDKETETLCGIEWFFDTHGMSYQNK